MFHYPLKNQPNKITSFKSKYRKLKKSNQNSIHSWQKHTQYEHRGVSYNLQINFLIIIITISLKTNNKKAILRTSPISAWIHPTAVTIYNTQRRFWFLWYLVLLLFSHAACYRKKIPRLKTSPFAFWWDYSPGLTDILAFQRVLLIVVIL